MAAALAATLRRKLLEHRVPDGHWEGHLSSSALATATAVAALAAARQATAARAGDPALVESGLRWLVASRNEDGGWGDTTDSVSNISTTALCWAALASGAGADVERAAVEAEAWIARAAGGADPGRLAAAVTTRYGQDRTFSVPILTMCAIAGRLGTGPEAWRVIPQLPFELALFPRRLFGLLRLPVVSYALPALISMGLARHSRGPRAAVLGRLRERGRRRVLEVLEGLQPAGGGFLEAIPLTSFVAMSLIAAGESGHPVVARGLEFLRRSVRGDGSWAVDSNLATWVTTLSLDALAAGEGIAAMDPAARRRLRDWLLEQQWRVEHPYTGAAPGGWAWTNLPGGVPDADDTAGALVALAILGSGEPPVRRAALSGVRWLLDLQNRDGGIPTFCRGWGTLPFDRSSSDLTAHALRAWAAWYPQLGIPLQRRTDGAIRRAVGFLSRSQRSDGAFVPLWFGNQAEGREENPVFGTGRVLKGLSAIADRETTAVGSMMGRAAAWLVSAQNTDGGWGAGGAVRSSIEETAVAVRGLACLPERPRTVAVDAAIDRGMAWIAAATGDGDQLPASPLGLYFARLWYSEELYPLIFAAGAASAAAAATPWTEPRPVGVTHESS